MATATKGHWRNKAELAYVEQILDNIYVAIIAQPSRFQSIAIPRLGCGYGGLDWKNQVRPLIVEYLASEDIPIDIYVFE